MSQEINKDIDTNIYTIIDTSINKSKEIDKDKEYYERIKKNEIYLKKQLNIFFGSGRPIYNISLDTIHIKKHNNPSSYII